MLSAHIVVDYNNLDKPFRLIERQAHCGGTEYGTICRLSEDHARLLSIEGITWLYGEPDWSAHYDKLDLYRAEKEKSDVEKRIAELTARSQP